MSEKQPSRGEVWMINLNPIKGHEQAGIRPALIVSVDLFNHGPAGLLVVIPITSREKKIPFHFEVSPPEGGLTSKSYIKCEDIRSVSKDRLLSPKGKVTSDTMAAIEDRIRILLNL